jgi:F420-non-reducing hydrogenase large subunit
MRRLHGTTVAGIHGERRQFLQHVAALGRVEEVQGDAVPVRATASKRRQATEMSTNVDICTRIEGHATIEYIMAKSEIEAVNFRTDVFRGFESILKGKFLLDVPRIASRICGLCHASQAIVSTRAIEGMLSVQPPASARAMRAVLICGELVKSHAMHYYFQGYPDLSEIFHHKQLGLEELVRKDPEFTRSMFELVKLGRDVCEGLGGREIHAISPVVGSKAFSLVPKEISQAKKQLEKIRAISRPLLENILKEYAACTPADDFAFKNVAFMALSPANVKDGIYRQDGDLSVMLPNGSVKHVSPESFNEFIWVEKGLRGYETSLDKSIAFMVGPMARWKLGALEIDDPALKATFHDVAAKWKDNMLFNYAFQLVDIHESASMAIEILSGLSGETTSDPHQLPMPEQGEGTGIIEAPRGTLIHHYTSTKGILDDVDLYIATKINIPLIDRILTTRCRALSDKGLAMDEIKRRAAMIVRAFDPCISCATHVITYRS